MKRKSLFLCALLAVNFSAKAQNLEEYVEKIKTNPLMEQVDNMAKKVVSTGFNAGDGYGEVWIRDFNTFIELSMEVLPDEDIRRNLNVFWGFQGDNGEIVDGFIDIKKADLNNVGGYKYRLSKHEPNYASHKNTVETDQEASLIQAIYKYVKKSGNYKYLDSKVAGMKVIDRMEWALNFLRTEKTDKNYELLIGGNYSRLGRCATRTHLGGRNRREHTFRHRYLRQCHVYHCHQPFH